MLWVLLGFVVLGALGVAVFHDELIRALIAAGIRLPAQLYARRGSALYLPLVERSVSLRVRDDGIMATTASPDMPWSVWVRQHGAVGGADPKPIDLALEFRFEVKSLLSAQILDPLKFATPQFETASAMLATSWRDLCQDPMLSPRIRIYGLEDSAHHQREYPLELALALLLEHRNLDTLDVLMQSPFAPEDRHLATCFCTGVERMQRTLVLSYHGQISPGATPDDERRLMQSMITQALYLARGLGQGDLVQRCLEHLEHPEDEPAGIKSLSAQILAEQILDDERYEAVRVRFSDLVWRDQARFEVAHMTSWFGEGVLANLSDEQLLEHGEQESSDLLQRELVRRTSSIKLLNMARLCWPLREKILRDVLCEDEGLALHGPSMLAQMPDESLVKCLGFLGREASPLLWRAPWFTRQLAQRAVHFDAAAWNALYDEILGEDNGFEGGFQSTRIARDVILGVANEALDARHDALRGAEMMHYQALSFMTRQRGGRVDLGAWQKLLDGLSAQQVERILRQGWLWDGELFTFMFALSKRAMFPSFVRQYPGCFAQMFEAVEITRRRRGEPLDVPLFGELMTVMLSQDMTVLDASKREEMYSVMVRTFIEESETQGVKPEYVATLHALAQRAPVRQAAMMNYTLGHWVKRFDHGAMSGAITHVDTPVSAAGGLTLKRKEFDGREKEELS